MRADCPDLTRPFLAAEHDREEIRRLVTEGLLHRVTGRVHVNPDVPDTLAGRAHAVRLALTAPEVLLTRCEVTLLDRVVVAFGTAAWVHAGGGPGPQEGRLDLVIPPGSYRPALPEVVLHEHRLGDRDVERLCGLTLTTPVRTAADLARTLPIEQAVAALDRLRICCGVRVVDVLDQLDRMPRCRGVATGRAVVHAWAAAIASAASAPLG